MNRALLRKCVVEAQWLFYACALAIFAFAWVRVWLVSRVGMTRFKIIIETFRDEAERFLPISLDAFLTYPGRIAVIYDEAIIILCVVIWSIARGTDAISGELGRGTMEMLLAQPLSRLQILMHQAAVTIGGVLLLAFVTWFGTFVGIQTLSAREDKPPPTLLARLLRLEWPFQADKTPEDKKEYVYTPLREVVDARDLLPGAVNLFSLGFFLAGLSTLVSACDRYRWRAIGIVVGIYVVQLIFKAVGVAVKDWHWLTYISFFTAYEPQLLVHIAVDYPQDAWSFVRTTADPNSPHALARLGPLGFCSILWSLGLACYAAAAARFCTRDLPPPL